MVRNSISNQVLSPLGYTMQDFRDESTHMPAEIQYSIMERIEELRKRIKQRVQILIAGVGTNGPGIYLISGPDYSNYTDTGYSVIGSGSSSARLTFIRRQYDSNCSMRDGVFTVLETKSQSEERQGVGHRMDMALVQPGRIKTLDETQIQNLRNKLTEIGEAERKAREKVMQEWNLDLN